MIIDIVIDEKELRRLIIDELARKLEGVTFMSDDINIEVKSKQNYRSEWESAAFRATLKVDTLSNVRPKPKI